MITLHIDRLLVERKLSVNQLAELVGITPSNISVLKNGRAKAIRFETLEALCVALRCQPGDLLSFTAQTDAPEES